MFQSHFLQFGEAKANFEGTRHIQGTVAFVDSCAATQYPCTVEVSEAFYVVHLSSHVSTTSDLGQIRGTTSLESVGSFGVASVLLPQRVPNILHQMQCIQHRKSPDESRSCTSLINRVEENNTTPCFWTKSVLQFHC